MAQAVPGRITSSPAFAAQGSRSGRFEVQAGDEAAQGERAEIRSGTDQAFPNGYEGWIRQSTLIPDGGFSDAAWRIVRQWHSTDSGSPAIALLVLRNPLRFRLQHGDDSRIDWTSPAIARNQWYDITVHWVSGENGTGFVELWYAPQGQTPQIQPLVDNNQPGDLVNNGTRKINITTRSDHSYYKTGLYRDDTPPVPPLPTDVVYHDAICMGTTRAQVGL